MKRFLILVGLAPGLAIAALPFTTAEVVYRPVDAGYAAEAVVEAGRESTLAAQVAGRVLALNVDAGDSVRRGQLLPSRIWLNSMEEPRRGAQAQANLQCPGRRPCGWCAQFVSASPSTGEPIPGRSGTGARPGTQRHHARFSALQHRLTGWCRRGWRRW